MPWRTGSSWSHEQWDSIPEDFAVDKDARYPGTVLSFYKWQGYGFIRPDQQGLVPDDKVWVHWSNIQTEDRYPFLMKDQRVAFGLIKWQSAREGKQTTTLRAKTVTTEGGELISLQDRVDAEKKEFVHGQQNLRYTGILKFYTAKQGYGYVLIDDGFELLEDVPRELRVEEHEVNCLGKRPTSIEENLAVEFGIVKNKKGMYMAYNMTLPGGLALTKANLEHREIVHEGAGTYTGIISFFQWRQGWGLITPDSTSNLPESIQRGLKDQQDKAKERKKKNGEHNQDPEQVFYFTKIDMGKDLNPRKEMRVTFKVYLDDKGVGAFDINPIEPCPDNV